MSHSCPTVKIVSPVSKENPNGYIVINEADFDKNEHELFDEAKALKKQNAKKNVQE